MCPHFPLEQMCSHSEENFQLAFARGALEIVRDQPDCKLQPTGKGLLILGETEDAVSRPVQILRSAYGARLAVGAITIRYRGGPVVEEPHMGVRVSCPANYCDAVRMNLEARGARLLHSTESERSLTVIRAAAPLAVLMGYSAFLTALTEGRARVAMWLSHYAPVPPPPPGGAAA
jgi:hypothetical protein